MTENATARIDLPVVRRMNHFWLAVIIAMLAIGCAQASTDHPTLWPSWHGPAMVALSLAFAEMEETKALVRSTMADLRTSLAGLRPPALEEQPLSGALAEMARERGLL